MEANSHLVTIGIPVFNGEEFIADAIESALRQTMTDFLVIISDNGSTDSTAKICKRYAEIDKRVRYVSQKENLGPVRNFNFLLEQAASKYFIWLACDDRWEKNFLQEMVSILDENDECTLAFSAMRVVNLYTGDEQRFLIGFSGTSKVFGRVLYRLINPCSNLVYGLQRVSFIRDKRVENFDFADMLWVNNHEIFGMIITSPNDGFICGTKGERVPYSLSGREISAARYIFKQARFFLIGVGFFSGFILSILNSYFYIRTTIFANKQARIAMEVLREKH